ncbi:MAG: protein translocase subunit SecF [Peptococcaceae bacterium]|nr:protein translocase subunit SecF [Peptococcaceae bacterium]
MAKKRQRRYGNNVKQVNPGGQAGLSGQGGQGTQGQADAAGIGKGKTQQSPASGVVTYDDVKKKYRFYFNIVAKRKIWFVVSALLVVVSVVSLVGLGLNLGMAFEGGTMVSMTFAAPITQQAVSDAVTSTGISGPQVQLAGDARAIIQTKELSEEQRDAMLAALREQVGPYDPESYEEEMVSESIGGELLRSALIALSVACALMLTYLIIRFKFNYAVAGVLALLHDIVVTIGVFSLLRWQIDPPFIAAVLTVFGYSINDKVVLFDRIRENEGLQKKRASYEDLVDQSIWQTMARSINTGLAVLLALFAIYFLGGDATKTFSLTMIIGVVIGMFSSVFLASQFVVVMKRFVKAS